jgi:predicted nucleic acid-binding protein
VTVVSDAGPLIHLSLVGRVDLLPLLYQRILIPDLVHQEVVQKGAGLAGSAEIGNADWIEIAEHDPGAPLIQLLSIDLDLGEAAAIWLAVDRRSEWILSDDRKARLAAERLGLKVRGSLGVLVEAKRRTLVPTIAPLLHELRAKGVWLSERLVEMVLREVDEAGP